MDEVLAVVARHGQCQIRVVAQALGPVADALTILACQGLVKLDMIAGTVAITDAGIDALFEGVTGSPATRFSVAVADGPAERVEVN